MRWHAYVVLNRKGPHFAAPHCPDSLFLRIQNLYDCMIFAQCICGLNLRCDTSLAAAGFELGTCVEHLNFIDFVLTSVNVHLCISVTCVYAEDVWYTRYIFVGTKISDLYIHCFLCSFWRMFRTGVAMRSSLLSTVLFSCGTFERHI